MTNMLSVEGRLEPLLHQLYSAQSCRLALSVCTANAVAQILPQQ